MSMCMCVFVCSAWLTNKVTDMACQAGSYGISKANATGIGPLALKSAKALADITNTKLCVQAHVGARGIHVCTE